MRRLPGQQALAFEMHLLLGPLTLLVGVAVMPVVTLGLPHVLGLVLGPVLREDARDIAVMAAVLPTAFVLSTAWSLGCATMRRERYRFGPAFWIAVQCTLVFGALLSWYVDPRAIALFAPVWVFMLHMALLQRRLRLAQNQ